MGFGGIEVTPAVMTLSGGRNSMFVRVTCVLALIVAVWCGFLVFGTTAGSNVALHAVFITSTAIYLICFVAIVARGASLHLGQQSESLLENEPDKRRRS